MFFLFSLYKQLKNAIEKHVEKFFLSVTDVLLNSSYLVLYLKANIGDRESFILLL